ncbi:hypothetical protein D3C76_1153470 [compost metagenome]
MQFPLHVELLGDVFEPGFEMSDITSMAIVETEHCTHEEFATKFVVELRHLTDIAAVACQV